MDVTIYMKKPLLEGDDIEAVLELTDVRQTSLISAGAMRLLGVAGLFSLTSEDNKRVELIPRENIERISCVLTEPVVSDPADELLEELDEFERHMRDDDVPEEFEDDDDE